MRPEKILHWLRAAPFQPFRVFLSDGSSYDVAHPELAFVSQHHFIVTRDLTADGVPRRTVMCDPLHVTRIEAMPADAGRA